MQNDDEDRSPSFEERIAELNGAVARLQTAERFDSKRIREIDSVARVIQSSAAMKQDPDLLSAAKDSCKAAVTAIVEKGGSDLQTGTLQRTIQVLDGHLSGKSGMANAY